MTFPPLSEQNCGNCRYIWAPGPPCPVYCRRNPPQIGPRGEQWPEITEDDWFGEWVSQEAQL